MKLNIHADFEKIQSPKIFVCRCDQCKYVKNKRKNRKNKAKIKRMLNKKRRTSNGVGIIHYWA